MAQSCVLVDPQCDISHIVVGLYSMDDGVGVGSHEQGGKSNEAAQFEDALRISLFKRVYKDYSLVLPNVHHGMFATEMVDGIENGLRVSFGC